MRNSLIYLFLASMFFIPIHAYCNDNIIKVTDDYYELDNQYYVTVDSLLRILDQTKSVDIVIDYFANTEKVLALIEKLYQLDVKTNIKSEDLFPEQNRKKARGF